MASKVAVEANLEPYAEYLSRKGYQVDSLDQAKLSNEEPDYLAVVISGADQNLMGMQDMKIGCPVINAEGMTPEDVYRRIENQPKPH